jgi:triosephosphate isomerase
MISRRTPLLCIGETLEQKEYGTSEEVLRTQIKIGLHGVCREDVSRIWLAYEPVWAIGVNGIPATREYASANHLLIKRTLQELFGEAGEAVPVLYGGSVHRDNADAYIEMPGIDGLFIGRAAWDADRFNDIIRSVLVRFVKKTGV